MKKKKNKQKKRKEKKKRKQFIAFDTEKQNNLFMRKEEVDRVRAGLEIKGWGRERGENIGEREEGKQKKILRARSARCWKKGVGR